MTEFFGFIPLQVIEPGNSWLVGVSSKSVSLGEENKKKMTFEDFNCTMDKMERDGGNKTQRK